MEQSKDNTLLWGVLYITLYAFFEGEILLLSPEAHNGSHCKGQLTIQCTVLTGKAILHVPLKASSNRRTLPYFLIN